MGRHLWVIKLCLSKLKRSVLGILQWWWLKLLQAHLSGHWYINFIRHTDNAVFSFIWLWSILMHFKEFLCICRFLYLCRFNNHSLVFIQVEQQKRRLFKNIMKTTTRFHDNPNPNVGADFWKGSAHKELPCGTIFFPISVFIRSIRSWDPVWCLWLLQSHNSDALSHTWNTSLFACTLRSWIIVFL